LHSTEDADAPRYPEWIRPVAADLERLGAPPGLSRRVLALLALTELDPGPTPRVGRVRDWLHLDWGAGDRALKICVHESGRVCWGRSGPGVLDIGRPLDRDHAAVARDLLGWLLRGEEALSPPDTRTRRKWWLP
jgi:hypothetical protein